MLPMVIVAVAITAMVFVVVEEMAISVVDSVVSAPAMGVAVVLEVTLVGMVIILVM